MNEQDRKPFFALVADVYAFYRQDFSAFAGSVWWEAMKPHDLAAVSQALSRHCINPDNGQFMPKPADVVKMLSGSTQDAALLAWAKVDRVVRTVGTWRSVVFDDALVHRVIAEMGGWTALGSKTEDEWPFVRNEFVNRYRGYRSRAEVPDYPPVLAGVAEAENRQRGFAVDPPMLIGQAEEAARVMRLGTSRPTLGMTPMHPQAAARTLRLVDARDAA